MKRQRDPFVPAAFYASQRKRSDWVKEGPEVLVERLKFLAERPRLAVTWGTWRRRRCRRAREGDN